MTTVRPAAKLRSFSALFALLSASVIASPQGQTPASSAPAKAPATFEPLVASVGLPWDSSRLKVGSHIQVRVQSPWTGPGCDLRMGALVEGHVSQVSHRSKTDKNSSMHVVFDSAECNHHRGTPLKVLLVAMLGPDAPPPGGESGVGLNPPLTDVPNEIKGMRSVEKASAVHEFALTGRSLPSHWKLGMVVDVPATTLTVGKGEGGGSIISAANKDVRLEATTLLIMAVVPTIQPSTSAPSKTP